MTQVTLSSHKVKHSLVISTNFTTFIKQVFVDTDFIFLLLREKRRQTRRKPHVCALVSICTHNHWHSDRNDGVTCFQNWSIMFKTNAPI